MGLVNPGFEAPAVSSPDSDELGEKFGRASSHTHTHTHTSSPFIFQEAFGDRADALPWPVLKRMTRVGVLDLLDEPHKGERDHNMATYILNHTHVGTHTHIHTHLHARTHTQI